MIKTVEHEGWCSFILHRDCCGKGCDCGSDDVNNYIAKMYSLLWEVASLPRVYTIDEEHVAVFIDVETAREIEDIVGYDEMGQ